jgi:transcriptional regulator with XRE-family HTH domain
VRNTLISEVRFRALLSGGVECLKLVKTCIPLLERRGAWYHKSYAHRSEVRASAGHLSAADGPRWTGQQLDEATGGGATRSYVTNLRKGRIENPGYAKLAAMAKAMGFAPELWFEQGATRVPDGRSDDSRGIVGRVEHLFDAVRNPNTGKPYTNAEVARMTLGNLSQEDVGYQGRYHWRPKRGPS